jgi:hypothetical protein
MNPEKQIEELEIRVKKLENILYGIANDVRTQAMIRDAVILGEHTADKPTIINKNGKKYNLQIV